jgi:Arc/MetJ-type ribon-helix-helix transcriptional regulator
VFDSASEPSSARRPGKPGARAGPEEERIALRCTLKELQLLDSFVASGEFSSRSELMRAALREFLRARTMSVVATPAMRSASGEVEVPVPLRSDEVETLSQYGILVSNGQPLSAVLAELVRRGALELKVSELVARARESVQHSREERASLGALERSGKELERKGVLGR